LLFWKFKKVLSECFVLSIGSIPGALLRWTIDNDFVSNNIGCFILGLLISLPLRKNIKLILCVGFCGSLTTFSGWIFRIAHLISNSNFIYALIILCGSTFYVIGGILTLKFLKNKGNENVATSTILWSLIFLFPLCLLQEPWINLKPSIESTIALIYLGIFPTGFAWMLRFHLLTKVGLVFQTQVAYLIPLFGVFFGYLIMNEQITWRVLVALIIIIVGIFIVKKNDKLVRE